MLHTSPAGKVRPTPKFETPVADRIAAVMIDLQAEDGAATRDRIIERLEQEGLTSFDLDLYEVEARKIANGLFVRHEDRPAVSRATRISRAATEIARLLPGMPAITLHLQARNFSKPELDDILHEAIAMAADEFAHQAGAQ
jgi:5,10-methylenetetrahydrofolate reductase